jgi:protein involved in polysaccharide export with SLBB domain
VHSTVNTAVAFAAGSAVTTGAAVPAILAKGVLNAMLLTKLKVGTAVVLGALAVSGAGMQGYRMTMVASAQEGKDSTQRSAAPVVRDRTALPAATPPPRVTKEDLEQRKAAYQAAKVEYEARKREFKAGRGTLAIFLESDRVLLLAEVALSQGDKAAQLAAYDAHVDRTLEAFEIARKRYEAGRLPIEDFVQLRRQYELAYELARGERAATALPVAKEVATEPAGYVIEPPDVLLVEYARPDATDPVKITGRCQVHPDGTIGLGPLGSVSVSGRTTEEARRAITEHLAHRLDGFDAKKLTVEIIASNSKVIYVITGGEGGDQVYRLPARGGDTVLDVLAAARVTLVGIGRKRVYVARPSAGRDNQVLPVDWKAITGEGDTTTNYSLKPGDRVYIQAPALPKAGGRIRKDSPALKPGDWRSP